VFPVPAGGVHPLLSCLWSLVVSVSHFATWLSVPWCALRSLAVSSHFAMSGSAQAQLVSENHITESVGDVNADSISQTFDSSESGVDYILLPEGRYYGQVRTQSKWLACGGFPAASCPSISRLSKLQSDSHPLASARFSFGDCSAALLLWLIVSFFLFFLFFLFFSLPPLCLACYS
jgi:hypothetical protein